jgi:two-component system cell cycle sensor histidine kinase/response regulator CckA
MTRVIIVDDKEENAYYLDALLSAHGYEVESARDGAEALAKARQAPPDLVISDLLMPGMDGYTLLRHWKADSALSRAPFIVYTATYTDPADEALALDLGADAFILKPAEPEDFMARVRAVQAALPIHTQRPVGDDTGHLREYSEILIRKLEQKMRELEQSNRRLREDIAEREKAEAALRESEQRFRQLEAQLRQAQKMEAVGRLAGGVAHDFNNMLSVILGYTGIVIPRLPPGEIRTHLEEVRRAGERATDLTRQLLAFSRSQMLRPRVVELGAVVRDLQKMLERLLGEDVALSLVLRPGAGRVHADPTQISQIVMNLAVNAKDAMPRGGELTIEVAHVEAGDARIAGRADATRGPHVMLAVTDTGVGMDAATRERIFEPFFTTKEDGKGTGLGLATVFGIVTQSHGLIEVDSEPGKGSSFKLFFPCTDRAVDPDAPAPRTPTTLRGSETILLVEDDEQVRKMNVEVLRGQGYLVLDARDGAEALATAASFGGEIHLLVTDVVMPGMSGPVLAERLAATRPSTKPLYVSGYAPSAIVHHGVLEAGIAFLPKPISPDALLHKVRELLTPA